MWIGCTSPLRSRLPKHSVSVIRYSSGMKNSVYLPIVLNAYLLQNITVWMGYHFCHLWPPFLHLLYTERLQHDRRCDFALMRLLLLLQPQFAQLEPAKSDPFSKQLRMMPNCFLDLERRSRLPWDSILTTLVGIILLVSKVPKQNILWVANYPLWRGF